MGEHPHLAQVARTRQGNPPSPRPRVNSSPFGTSLPTPINAQKLEDYLEGYVAADKLFLVEGFSQGFMVPYHGPREFRMSKNHLSCLQNPQALNEKIQSEVDAGRILGPFSTPPVHNLICSPLGLVPKREPGSFRLIHDLSFPKGDSVNSGIAPEDTTVSYEKIDSVISLVKAFGRHALLAKSDIENAFRLLPIRPSDMPLLGFTCKKEDGSIQFYMDACLPMGLSISCQVFERFSCALQWVMETKYHASLSHMIDDFCFVGPPASDACGQALDNFLRICRDIGIPIKKEKTVRPTTCLTIYGIEIDTDEMSARLPQEKVEKINCALASMSKRKRVTLKELQSLLGLLNFASLVVVPGRTFLRRLYDLTRGMTNPNHHIRLTKEARKDLQAWETFMSDFNGKSLFMFDDWVSSDSLRLQTDSAESCGYAAVLGHRWFAGRWPAGFEPHHINTLELFPIVVALELWGSLLANHKLLFLSDNTATVDVINSMTSRCPNMMRLLRRLVLVALRHNIWFRAKHIAGKSNIVADRLSRFDFQAAREAAPWLDKDPAVVPTASLCI